MSDSVRVPVVLPPELVGQLDYIASRAGCSRSAVVRVLVEDSLGGLPIGEVVRDEDHRPGSRRLRGVSADELRERIQAVMVSGQQGDLF